MKFKHKLEIYSIYNNNSFLRLVLDLQRFHFAHHLDWVFVLIFLGLALNLLCNHVIELATLAYDTLVSTLFDMLHELSFWDFTAIALKLTKKLCNLFKN